MFSQAPVCSQDVMPWEGRPPSKGRPPSEGRPPPLGGYGTATGYGQQVGGTHPTGMHPYSTEVLLNVFDYMLTQGSTFILLYLFPF